MGVNLTPVALNVEEAAKLLGVSRPTLYQIIRRSDFPAYKIAGRVLIDYESLKEWSRKQAKNNAAV